MIDALRAFAMGLRTVLLSPLLVLGITVGWIASRVSLAAGFGLIAVVYALAFGSACWPMKTQQAVASAAD